MSGSLVAALVSLRLPYRDFIKYNPLSNNGDLPILLLGLVVFILAYATNPSESSFRAFLTELSFRHHLSRLDDCLDNKPNPKSAYIDLHGHRNSPAPFHFANRASLSLRTPKHAFHSFGIFTIAAIVPLTRAERTELNPSVHRDGSMISDSWFIGAFGKWWRGGVIEAWYRDVIARPTGDESWTSGILSMKALDRINGHHVLPFTHKKPSLLGPTKGSPPRVRNRDRPAQRSGNASRRSSTPPPLPKTASLPLHTPRIQGHSPVKTSSPAAVHSVIASVDQSPRLTELHRQISAVQTSITELRTQSSDLQTSVADSRASLQTELDIVRERRRLEDVAKAELKSRIKSLDDSRRVAESAKRDAEKRLKAAHASRDDASQRIQRLDSEIVELQASVALDKSFIQDAGAQMLDSRAELRQALDLKKKEIKIAEDVIVGLGSRTKELEENLSNAKDCLSLIQTRNQDPIVQPRSSSSPWSPVLFSPTEPTPSPHGNPSDPASRPTELSLGSLSNFHSSTNSVSFGHTSGYTPYSQATIPDSGTSSNFTVFDDEVVYVPPTPGGPFSPTGQSLIPSGLFSSLDLSETLVNPLSSTLQPRAGVHWPTHDQISPMLAHTPAAFPTTDYRDPFEVRMPSEAERRRIASESSLDLPSHGLSRSQSIPEPTLGETHRRWFSVARGKSTKGLNPDAQAFNLIPRSPIITPSEASMGGYDALNPHGMLTHGGHTTTSSLHRAFAPSPAEREVFQRLGGSTNASLELLPSLNDVRSLPSSPAHAQIQPAAIAPTRESSFGRDFTKSFPSWLQLPKKKTTFSPWADEDSTSTPTQEAKLQQTAW